jgi:hypothetical protein
MIVGNGLIAKNCFLIDREDVLFFASGVSNSMSNNKSEFEREINLLNDNLNTEKKIIYFSSIDEYVINEKYLEHKKKIENIIKTKTDNFIIMKIPQLIGKYGNSNNFINHVVNCIKNDLEFDVFLTERSLLDVMDLITILNNLLEINYTGIVNINYIELMKVEKFISIIENMVNKKAKIKNYIPMKQEIKVNNGFVNSLLETSIGNTLSYNSKVIDKYFR